jgi:MFS family permease
MVGSLLAQPFTTLLPIYARDILEAGPTGQGFLLTAMGVGAVSGAVLIASIGDALPKGALMMSGLGIYGLCVVGFGVSPWFAVSTAFMVVAGLCNISVHALIQTIVQGHSPPELRGRMMGAFQQTQVMWTLGSMIAGALASAWTAPWALAAMGGACTACAVAIPFAFPRARFIR